MDRRVFVKSSAAFPLILQSGRGRQDSARPPAGTSLSFGVPEVALTFLETGASVLRHDNGAQSKWMDQGRLLSEAVALTAAGRPQSTDRLNEFIQAANGFRQQMVATSAKRVPEFANYFDDTLKALGQDLDKWQKTSNPVAFTMPSEKIRCICVCPLDHACKDPVEKALLTCALTALPGLRVGPGGYFAVLGTCLLAKVADTSADLVVECLKPLRDCLANCFKAS